MFVAKQDIKSVPLHLIFEAVQKAGNDVEDDLVTREEDNYEAMILRKEKEWNDTHEAPYEGNFRDAYPYTPPKEEYVAKAKKKAQEEALVERVAALGLKNKAAWFLPQMTAYIAKMKLPRNEEGLIDPILFRNNNFGIDAWHRGLWMVATIHQRGLIVPNQSTPEYINYCAFVPLLMMPFKKFDRVNYKEWSRKGIKCILDYQLGEAMMFEGTLELTNEELLQIRDTGLKIGSGAKFGESRNPVSYHKLYKIEGTPLQDMPWLCQDMATQIWGAHPINRTNLMILDWNDWDKMPDQLISHDVTKKAEAKQKLVSAYDW